MLLIQISNMIKIMALNWNLLIAIDLVQFKDSIFSCSQIFHMHR